MSFSLYRSQGWIAESMRENKFKEALLNPSAFPVTWELVPGRGARETAQENALALARQAAGDRFRERHHVGRHPKSPIGEPVAGPPAAALHLVEDQQELVLVGQAPQSG